MLLMALWNWLLIIGGANAAVMLISLIIGAHGNALLALIGVIIALSAERL